MTRVYTVLYKSHTTYQMLSSVNQTGNESLLHHAFLEVGSFHVNNRFHRKDTGQICDKHGNFQPMDIEVGSFHVNHRSHPYKM